MPAIKFEASGIAPVIFQRADGWGRALPGDEGQISAESQAGLVRVATLRPPRQFTTLNWKGKTTMLVTDYVALGIFLKALPFRAKAFTFTDSDGAQILVRYWEGYYSAVRISPLLVQVELRLRHEVYQPTLDPTPLWGGNAQQAVRVPYAVIRPSTEARPLS